MVLFAWDWHIESFAQKTASRLVKVAFESVRVQGYPRNQTRFGA